MQAVPKEIGRPAYALVLPRLIGGNDAPMGVVKIGAGPLQVITGLKGPIAGEADGLAEMCRIQ